jgi:hypothetical protein
MTACSWENTQHLKDQIPELAQVLFPGFETLYDEHGRGRNLPPADMQSAMSSVVKAIRANNLAHVAAWHATNAIFSRLGLYKPLGTWEIVHPHTIPLLARIWPGRHRDLNFGQTLAVLEYAVVQQRVPAQAMSVGMLVMFSLFQKQAVDITNRDYFSLASMAAWNAYELAKISGAHIPK